MDLFAHSLPDRPEGQGWEPLSHHLAAVGERAQSFAAAFGASSIALAAGLLHDIGKCSSSYQRYIRRPAEQNSPKGPDHSTAGAKEAVAVYGLLGRIMAFGIAGHHAGLMDGSGHEGTTLESRLKKEVDAYDGWRDQIAHLPTHAELTKDFRPPRANGVAPRFELAFLARMLFSCLVDADFLETEAFYAQSRDSQPSRGGVLQPQHWEVVRAYMVRHRREDTPVNILRSAILDHANAKAGLPPGLFTLTVPTGGGKTLTSLSFAMEQPHRSRRFPQGGVDRNFPSRFPSR